MRSGKIKLHRDAVANVVGIPGASQRRTTGVLSSILVLLLGASLIPASAASAAQLPGAVPAAVPTATQLLDFNRSAASVRVGGQLADTVWVTPRAARTVSVQYRRAGTTPFTTAYKAKASPSGAFTAFLMPRAAGTWQFRLAVAATTQAKGMVSPIRTVKASGTAVASKVIGFVSTPTTIPVGTLMRDAVSVSPRAPRLVELQSRRAGTSTWTWSAPGRSTMTGNFTAVYRPMSAGVFQYRLWVRASGTARGAVSATRTVIASSGVTGLFVKADSSTPTSIALHWKNPTFAGFTGVMIRRAVGTTAPATPTSGTKVRDLVDNVPYMVDISGIKAGTTYSYALFAHNGVPNYAAAAKVTFTTATVPGAANPVLSISDMFANEVTSGTMGESLFFYAGDSAKGPSPASVVLNYGDGTSKVFNIADDPTNWSEDHTYTSAATFQVTLKVTSSAGVVVTKTVPVTIT